MPDGDTVSVSLSYDIAQGYGMVLRTRGRSTEREYSAEVRRFSSNSVRSAWLGLGLSTLLLTIGLITIYGMLSKSVSLSQKRAYLMIVWLFLIRFLYSVWRLYVTWREAQEFRKGVNRQLAATLASDPNAGAKRAVDMRRR